MVIVGYDMGRPQIIDIGHRAYNKLTNTQDDSPVQVQLNIFPETPGIINTKDSEVKTQLSSSIPFSFNTPHSFTPNVYIK